MTGCRRRPDHPFGRAGRPSNVSDHPPRGVRERGWSLRSDHPSAGAAGDRKLQIVGLGYFPSLLNLRSDAGVAQNVPVKIERIYPTWWTGPLIALLLAGLGVTIYWVIRVAGLVIGLFGE